MKILISTLKKNNKRYYRRCLGEYAGTNENGKHQVYVDSNNTIGMSHKFKGRSCSSYCAEMTAIIETDLSLPQAYATTF